MTRQRYIISLREGTKGDMRYAEITRMINKTLFGVIEPFAKTHGCMCFGRIIDLTNEELAILTLQLPPNLILDQM